MKRRIHALTGLGLVFAAGAVLAQPSVAPPSTPPTAAPSAPSQLPRAQAPTAPRPNDLEKKDSSPAGASGGVTVQNKDFGRLDANGDGKVNAEESRADARLHGRFARVDENGDGQVTESEYRVAASRGDLTVPSRPKPAAPKEPAG